MKKNNHRNNRLIEINRTAPIEIHQGIQYDNILIL